MVDVFKNDAALTQHLSGRNRCEGALVVAGGLLALWLVVRLLVVLPLGAGEATTLAALRDLSATGAEPLRLLKQDFAAGLPVFNLACSLMASAVLGTKLVALRLPDALAVVLAAVVFAVTMPRGVARVLGGLVFAASPLLWFLPVAVTGAGVDVLAALVLYRAAAKAARASVVHRLAAGTALVVLALNGVGPYAIALAGGPWLHGVLVDRELRFMGSIRLTVLGLLACAGMSAVGMLALPLPGRLAGAFDEAGSAIGLSIGSVMLAWGVPALLLAAGVFATIVDPRGTGGRAACALWVGLFVAASAIAVSSTGLVCLAPIGLVWVVAPLAIARGRDVFVMAVWCFWVAIGAFLVVWLGATGFRPLYWTEMVLLVASVALLTASGVGVFVQWRAPRTRQVPLASVGLALLAILLGLGVLVWQPLRWQPIRVYRHQLIQTMSAEARRPIATLSPVSADWWRVALDRPIYRADSAAALCGWIARLPSGLSPVILLAPRSVPHVEHSLALHFLLQAPGSERTSIIVATPRTSDGCRAGKAATSG